MTNDQKIGIFYGLLFILLICGYKYVVPLDLLLSNATKLIIGCAFILVDLAHRRSYKIAVGTVAICGIISYMCSHSGFAAVGGLTYYFTFAMELYIFNILYYKYKKPFAHAMLLSNAAPAFFNGIAWSYLVGSFDDSGWAPIANYVLAATVAAFLIASALRPKSGLMVLWGVAAVLAAAILYFFTAAWVDPAAEGWANWFLLHIPVDVRHWIGLPDSVALSSLGDLQFIAVTDYVVSAAYSLMPPAFFAFIYHNLERRKTTWR